MRIFSIMLVAQNMLLSSFGWISTPRYLTGNLAGNDLKSVPAGSMRLLVGKNSKVGHRKSSIPAFMVEGEDGRKAEQLQISKAIALIEEEIAAVEYCLKGRDPSNAPEEIREEVLIYEGIDRDVLVEFLFKLETKLTAVLKLQKAAKREVEGVSLVIPDSFNFNVSSWEVGEVVSCKELSEAMRPFGGFPESLLVREEMKGVWSKIIDGIMSGGYGYYKEGNKWVILGSPGTGKSVLAVLLCFYLAKALNFPVFLARQLKDENGENRLFAVCIHPGGRAEGYADSRNEGAFNLNSISNKLWGLYGKCYTALDGWNQEEMIGTQFGADFGGFELLTTSTDYHRKSQDVRWLVVLPAWKEKDLKVLWDLRRPNDFPGFEMQYYYTGGSASQLLQPFEDIQNRIESVIINLLEPARDGIKKGLGVGYVSRLYLTSMDMDSYLNPRRWKFICASQYVLKRLIARVPLAEFEKGVEIAETVGSAAYGWQYEALLHKLFHLPDNVSLTLHLKPYESLGDNSGDAYEVVGLKNFTEVTCMGSNEIKATEYLSTQKVNMERSSYWYPDFPTYPVIDSILWVPDKKIVFYFQVTVASRHEVNVSKLEEIHDAVKRSLASVTDITGWSYKYVAIAPSLDMSNALGLRQINADISNCAEVQICHGYVKYRPLRDVYFV